MLYSHVIPFANRSTTQYLDKKLIHRTEKFASQDYLELTDSFITSSLK